MRSTYHLPIGRFNITRGALSAFRDLRDAKNTGRAPERCVRLESTGISISTTGTRENASGA